ncbi:MAG: urea amidolyase family protein [Corticimicrobacter sp.]|uniref:5-oxoprolinase subunit B/C family protein n=1 Tax=Corticimicrobacter sp. TaxID=2678536 RepID=UPI0032D9E9FA
MTISAAASDLPSIEPLGDAALTVVFGRQASPDNSALALGFATLLSRQREHDAILGSITEWAPAFCSVTVWFDPLSTDRQALVARLQTLAGQGARLEAEGSEWLIPVCFDPRHAPDLDNLAQACGLDVREVIALMTATTFTVRMLGFLPGFPYMDGLPPVLSQPRLKTPRKAVPARSIAIAGEQCAAYPWESPGGWHLLGQTPVPLFSLDRPERPALLVPGDRVRWRAIAADEYETLEARYARPGWSLQEFQPASHTPGTTQSAALAARGQPSPERASTRAGTLDAVPDTTADGLLEIIDPAWAASIQDQGRAGYRALGIPLSGALDPSRQAVANALAGNTPQAATLELLGGGPRLAVLRGPVRCALAGAGTLVRTSAAGLTHTLPAWRGIVLHTGDTLQVRLDDSQPAYLALSGGILSEPVLGSRATYGRARLGGLAGEPLRAGHRLPCTALTATDARTDLQALPIATPPSETRHGNTLLTLRVITGPQSHHFTEQARACLCTETYTVSRDADRMGLRLEGPELRHGALGADIVTDGITPGAIQVPANGQPIILLADAQTTGGYAKIATVIQADLPLLAQLAPCSQVAFRHVDATEALAALQVHAEAAAGWHASLRKMPSAGELQTDALAHIDYSFK